MQAPVASRAQDSIGPGTKLGEYELVRLLGKGGMGSVYLARHHLKFLVAIKLLNRESVRPSNLIRLEEEAKKLAMIQDVHVVQFKHYERGTESTPPYIVMEYLKGETLSERLSRLGRAKDLMPIGDAVAIGCAMSRAIASAHDFGIVHRDLKPSNVFLCDFVDGPQVKVLDFGIAKVLDKSSPDLTQDGQPVGTPGWMAPEQIKGRGLNESADQYSLGAVLYFALTGRPPFPVDMALNEAEREADIFRRAASGQFARPREVRREVPEELEAIVLRAMNTDPGARFPDVRALGRALLRFAPADSSWRMTKFFETPSSARTSVRPTAEQRAAGRGEATAEPVTAPTAAATSAWPSREGGGVREGGRKRSRARVTLGLAAAAAATVGSLLWATWGPAGHGADLAAAETGETDMRDRSEIEVVPSVPTLVREPAATRLPEYSPPSSAMAAQRRALGTPTVLGATAGGSLGVRDSVRGSPSKKSSARRKSSSVDWDLVTPSHSKADAKGDSRASKRASPRVVQMIGNSDVPDL